MAGKPVRSPGLDEDTGLTCGRRSGDGSRVIPAALVGEPGGQDKPERQANGPIDVEGMRGIIGQNTGGVDLPVGVLVKRATPGLSGRVGMVTLGLAVGVIHVEHPAVGEPLVQGDRASSVLILGRQELALGGTFCRVGEDELILGIIGLFIGIGFLTLTVFILVRPRKYVPGRPSVY